VVPAAIVSAVTELSGSLVYALEFSYRGSIGRLAGTSISLPASLLLGLNRIRMTADCSRFGGSESARDAVRVGRHAPARARQAHHAGACSFLCVSPPLHFTRM
jgi:hypothetical protein